MKNQTTGIGKRTTCVHAPDAAPSQADQLKWALDEIERLRAVLAHPDIDIEAQTKEAWELLRRARGLPA